MSGKKKEKGHPELDVKALRKGGLEQTLKDTRMKVGLNTRTEVLQFLSSSPKQCSTFQFFSSFILNFFSSLILQNN